MNRDVSILTVFPCDRSAVVAMESNPLVYEAEAVVQELQALSLDRIFRTLQDSLVFEETPLVAQYLKRLPGLVQNALAERLVDHFASECKRVNVVEDRPSVRQLLVQLGHLRSLTVLDLSPCRWVTFFPEEEVRRFREDISDVLLRMPNLKELTLSTMRLL